MHPAAFPFLALPLLPVPAPQSGGGPVHLNATACISPEQRAEAQAAVARFLATSPSPADGSVVYPFYPQAGVHFEDLFAINFNDLDPSPGTLDWSCAPTAYTYDGHAASDTMIRSFGEQAVGVPIYAALDGTVIAAVDGNFDMVTNPTGSEPANYVIVSHGGGRFAYYWHMKMGSVAVSPGESVVAGQQIGLIGSSGFSSSPHLHFESWDGFTLVEPYAGPCNPGPSGWVDQVPADPLDTSLFLYDFAFARQPLASFVYPDEMPRDGYYEIGDPLTYWWVYLPNMPAFSTYRYELVLPSGAVAYDSGTVPFGIAEFYPFTWWWWADSTMASFAVPGTWKLRLYVNGAQIVEAPVESVASGAPTPNRAPEAITAVLGPDSPTASDTLACAITSTSILDDRDYDIVRYRYVWTVDGNVARDVASAARSDRLPAQPGGSFVTVTVTPGDGQGDGPATSVSTWVQPEPYGCGFNPAASLVVLGGEPALGSTLTLGVDNPAGTQTPGSLAFLALAGSPDPGTPCGTLIPGWGMSGPFGELLLSVVAPNPLAVLGPAAWSGPGVPAGVPTAFSTNPALVGVPLYYQGLLFDATGGGGIVFGLTEALQVVVGP